MKVEGYTINEADEAHFIEWMKGRTFGTAALEMEIQRRADSFGNHKLKGVAMRLADRMVQRERKAGRLENVGEAARAGVAGRAVWSWRES